MGSEFTPVPLLHPVVTAHSADIEGQERLSPGTLLLNSLCLTFAAASAVWVAEMIYRASTGVIRSVRLVEERKGNCGPTASFHENLRTVWRVGAVMPVSQKSGEEWRNYEVFSL